MIFTYKFWCYDNTTGTVVFPNSVEVEVEASDEEEALALAEYAVKRECYKLNMVIVKEQKLPTSKEKNE